MCGEDGRRSEGSAGRDRTRQSRLAAGHEQMRHPAERKHFDQRIARLPWALQTSDTRSRPRSAAPQAPPRARWEQPWPPPARCPRAHPSKRSLARRAAAQPDRRIRQHPDRVLGQIFAGDLQVYEPFGLKGANGLIEDAHLAGAQECQIERPSPSKSPAATALHSGAGRKLPPRLGQPQGRAIVDGRVEILPGAVVDHPQHQVIIAIPVEVHRNTRAGASVGKAAGSAAPGSRGVDRLTVA